MRILHFSNKPVYPKVDGGCAAMASVLLCLHQAGHTIDHICISTEKHPFSPENYPSYVNLPLTGEESFVSTKVTLPGALISLLKRENYNLSRFYSADFASRLNTLLQKESYDTVILDSAFLVNYIDNISSNSEARIILRTHNVEFNLWEQQAMNAGGIKRFYLKDLARTLKREEIRGLNKCECIWTISQEDEKELLKRGITSKIETIPFALEISSSDADYNNADFMHFGSMNWHPNKESLNYLLEEIWPEVNPETTLHVAGSFTDKSVSDRKNVITHGFVKDHLEFLQSNGTLLAPLLSGSGVRIKLLEAMAAGVPCVTTPIGASGISDPEKHLCIAKSKAEWIEIIDKLFSSVHERENSGSKGKSYIRKYHSFEAVIEKIQRSLGK